MKNKSHLTAIARKTLPVPVNWLLSKGFLKGHLLDYGCGKCKELNDTILANQPGIISVNSYDPHYSPDEKILPSNGEGWYHVILCTYVLCTLPESDEKKILRDVQRHLCKNGVAFVTVRADEPKNGYGVSFKGTFQRNVNIEYLYLLRKTTQYRIYILTHDCKL